MNLKQFFSAATLVLLCVHLYGQGSADPGFCTAGSLGELSSNHVKDSTAKKHSMRITESVALGEDNVVILPSALDVYLQLNKWLRFQIHGPIFMARHKDVKTVTIGDIFLMYNIKAFQKKQH